MPFRFTNSDLDLTDGMKTHAIQLRRRLIELYNELLPLMESTPELNKFIKPSTPRNGLRTTTPYVPRYTIRTRGVRRSTWIGYADKNLYKDPRIGLQYQFGIRRDQGYWFGLWMQGDNVTRHAELKLHQILKIYTLDEIASSINSLGENYWLNVMDDDNNIVIDNSTDQVTPAEVEIFLDELDKRKLWITLDKVFRDHTQRDLLAIKNVPEEILNTTLELLPIYNWWSGARPRETPTKEAFSELNNDNPIDIFEDGEFIPTGAKTSSVSSRVGQNLLRRVVFENYGHQCALCDIKGDDLLIASHISPWAKDRANRGNPRNVLCLCLTHDSLFEKGKLLIAPDGSVEFSKEIVSLSQSSEMLKAIIGNTTSHLRQPIKSPADSELLKKKLIST
jgi:hypothetical protein